MKKAIELLHQALSPLYDHREENAIINSLLEEEFGISRINRVMNPSLVFSKEETERIEKLCSRLSTGEPMQYALGYEYFLGRRFMVNKDVLIPRPETAELVEWIVDIVKRERSLPITHNPSPTTHHPQPILDIGTGCGCIALSLAALINNSQVFAADLSTAALDMAKQNAEALCITNIEFLEMDILADSDKHFQHPSVDKFDIIVSNPPYITNKEKAEMCRNVLDFEPHLALFVPDNNPLLFYRAICNFGKNNLRDGGLLFFEINAALGKETYELLKDFGYKDIELRQDITGRDRMIKARYEDSK